MEPIMKKEHIQILHYLFFKVNGYTDEHLKWDKPPPAVCLLIDLSVTLPLNLY
jgi:hypothetical protein